MNSGKLSASTILTKPKRRQRTTYVYKIILDSNKRQYWNQFIDMLTKHFGPCSDVEYDNGNPYLILKIPYVKHGGFDTMLFLWQHFDKVESVAISQELIESYKEIFYEL